MFYVLMSTVIWYIIPLIISILLYKYWKEVKPEKGEGMSAVIASIIPLWNIAVAVVLSSTLIISKLRRYIKRYLAFIGEWMEN